MGCFPGQETMTKAGKQPEKTAGRFLSSALQIYLGFLDSEASQTAKRLVQGAGEDAPARFAPCTDGHQCCLGARILLLMLLFL
jgi:hypothetical protein